MTSVLRPRLARQPFATKLGEFIYHVPMRTTASVVMERPFWG
jgi:hypothetical protein